MVAAGVYVRISRDRAGAGLGVQRQEEDCRALAARLGWEVGEVYVDNDLSAFTGKPRPAFDRMLADVDAGRIGAVIVWHVDRLTRQPKELEHVIDVADATGLQLATFTGEIDLATPTGRLMARIVGSTARYESEHKAERQRRANLQRAEQGRAHGGGRRGYGYTTGRELVEEEAAHLRWAAEQVGAGFTLRDVCLGLAERGAVTTTGKLWNPARLRDVLTNPTIAGQRAYKGKVIADADWPAIVDERTWNRLQRRFYTRGKRENKTYLLSGGLTLCGRCGARLVACPGGRNRAPSYCCAIKWKGKGEECCGRLRIVCHDLDDYVATLVLARLASPLASRVLSGTRRDKRRQDELLGQVADLERKLGELGEDFADGRLDRLAFRAASDRLGARLDQARRSLDRSESDLELPRGRSPEQLAAWWESAPLGRRRALIGLFVASITVNPARHVGEHGKPSSRVSVTWR